jgi:hypothetical protein
MTQPVLAVDWARAIHTFVIDLARDVSDVWPRHRIACVDDTWGGGINKYRTLLFPNFMCRSDQNSFWFFAELLLELD